jgi:4-amino-4-deoxy-L-arabinose transferase-like glycosyltransferase
MQVRVIILLLASIVVILLGQVDRELLPPDDLREAEVAREMYKSGDYVIPHLAGLPFVEKPPGFPALVAAAYKIAGAPSATAAHFTAAAFALASLLAVFLLGWRILGIENGALAAAILAISQRFCRTSHEVLLDNALTAAIAFTMLFTWIALEEDIPRRKHYAYSAAGFSLGVSFLFKGLIGLTIFGSGFLLYILACKRYIEFRHIVHPLPVIAFLLPVLSWTVPFLVYGSPDLIREFFITNHLGRFYGSLGHYRPGYFYFKDIWQEFAPGSILLPFAIWLVWKTRRKWENRAGIFFLCLFVGPLMVLSASTTKQMVYFLPVHTVLAIFVAWSLHVASISNRHDMLMLRVLTWVLAAMALIFVGSIVVKTNILGGVTTIIAAALIIFLLLATTCLLSIHHDNLRWASVSIVALFTLGWSLWFTGPLAHADIVKNSIRQPMMEALNLVGNREILLYLPNDDLRGGLSFYRDRTAQEIRSPDMLVAELGKNPDKYVALTYSCNEKTIPPELQLVTKDMGIPVNIEACFKLDDRYLLLITTRHEGIRRLSGIDSMRRERS